jgi:hypothetical protein
MYAIQINIYILNNGKIIDRHLPLESIFQPAGISTMRIPRSRYNDYFSVSKESGEFKMCQGKESGGGKSSCGCTDAMWDSQLEMNSDCIKKVPLTHFSSHVIPNIKLYVGNNVFSKGYKYKLVELNNRTDYCATGTC